VASPENPAPMIATLVKGLFVQEFIGRRKIEVCFSIVIVPSVSSRVNYMFFKPGITAQLSRKGAHHESTIEDNWQACT
jgi:hypothetical protein